MSDLFKQKLRDEIRARRVVVVVGAGVSVAATQGVPVASWSGLLKDGIDRARQSFNKSDDWAQRLLDRLEHGSIAERIEVAEEITRALGGPAGGEFGSWLRDTVGTLVVRDRSVIEALSNLGAPLLTTNYDGLLEEVTGRGHITWQEPQLIDHVIRSNEAKIVHLHGCWEQPSSVILGVDSYDKIRTYDHFQRRLRALLAVKTCVFVGFGSGLDDPHFAALWAWFREAFAGAQFSHFRLDCEDRAKELKGVYGPDDRMRVLSYGSKHEDLAPYLGRLAKTEKSRESTRSRRFALAAIVVVLAALASLGWKFFLQAPSRTAAAWAAYNQADYQRAKERAEKCIKEFKGDADRTQDELTKAGVAEPPIGEVKDRQERQVILDRGQLNDVATCLWLKGRCAEKLGELDEACKAYQQAKALTYARCLDQDGKTFFSPALKASDDLDNLAPASQK